MALRITFRTNARSLTYGADTYEITPDGTLVGLPVEVEKALLALGGYARIPAEANPASAAAPAAPAAEPVVIPQPVVQTPVTTPAPIVTPDDIRAAINAAVNAARPKNLEEATKVARDRLLELTGGVIPDWLSVEEKVGLGLDKAPEAPTAAPEPETAPVASQTPPTAEKKPTPKPAAGKKPVRKPGSK